MGDVDHDTEAEKTAAGEIVGSIDDLLLEIFRRVPSENDNRNNPLFKLASHHLNSQASYCYPLVQLILVSRRWNSLISNNFRLSMKPVPATRGLIFECDPSSSNHTTSFYLFLDKSKSTHKPFRKIDDTWHSHSKVVHSCNGLLLCASKRTSRDYSVCNPTTGKHSALPHVPSANNKVVRGVYLAFDLSKSPHYKVVCVLGLEDDNRHFQFVVYSSETGCWGKCGKLFKTKNVRFGNGVYWNGAIHWVVGSNKIICFNPDDGLAPPKKVRPMRKHCDHERYYFGASYGHLHCISFNEWMRKFVVHEMRSDYSGWAVKFKFDVTNAVRHAGLYFDYYESFDVYAVVRGESSEDTFLVLGTSSSRGGKKKIIQFNHHDHTFQTIHDFSGFKNHLENPHELRPFQYIESLVSV